MKKLIDIEKLVQWTLRDEMPKGFRMTADIRHVVKRKLYRRGRLIADTLGAISFDDGDDGNFGKVPGEAHADAQLVADAISALNTSMCFDHRRDVLRLFGEWALIADDCVRPILEMRFDARGSRSQWIAARVGVCSTRGISDDDRQAQCGWCGKIDCCRRWLQ